MSSDSQRLRVIFMGTPAFAVPVLDALVEAGCDVAGVYTQPDRESGRGRRLTETPVKIAALRHGLPVFQPASLRHDEAARQRLYELHADLIVVAAYGLFLPREVFESPRYETLNIHPSLLPMYRGASPVSTAILNGDEYTGVTIMKIAEAMDAGDIVAQVEVPIDPDETTDVLTDRLFRIGAMLLTEILPAWIGGEITPYPQDESLATETRRLTREDGLIDWNQPAEQIARQVRAYHPWPGTFTHWQGKMLKVLPPAQTADDRFAEPPGTVVSVGDGLAVVTGDGALLLEAVQMEGRRASSIGDFAQGYRDFRGSTLGL
jgi:methionyl-tRNA formyltransferase